MSSFRNAGPFPAPDPSISLLYTIRRKRTGQTKARLSTARRLPDVNCTRESFHVSAWQEGFYRLWSMTEPNPSPDL